MEGCVVRFEGCTLQEVLPGLQKSRYLDWVITNMLWYAYVVYLEVDKSPSTSFDLLPYCDSFQHLRKLTIKSTRPVIWVKARPYGRILNRECLGLTYNMLDTKQDLREPTGSDALSQCIEVYCSTDHICTQATKLSRHLRARKRECSLVVCFRVVFLSGHDVDTVVSGTSHSSTQSRILTSLVVPGIQCDKQLVARNKAVRVMQAV